MGIRHRHSNRGGTRGVHPRIAKLEGVGVGSRQVDQEVVVIDQGDKAVPEV